MKCVYKVRNKSGKIVAYSLASENGEFAGVIKTNELKDGMRTGMIFVSNLQISKDGKLIDRKDNQFSGYMHKLSSLTNEMLLTDTTPEDFVKLGSNNIYLIKDLYTHGKLFHNGYEVIVAEPYTKNTGDKCGNSTICTLSNAKSEEEKVDMYKRFLGKALKESFPCVVKTRDCIDYLLNNSNGYRVGPKTVIIGNALIDIMYKPDYGYGYMVEITNIKGKGHTGIICSSIEEVYKGIKVWA